MIWPQVPRSKTATIAPEAKSSNESYSLYSLSLEALHLLFIGCSIAEKCFYVLLDPSVSTQFHNHLRLALSQFEHQHFFDEITSLAFLDVVDYVCLCVHTACLYAKQKKVK